MTGDFGRALPRLDVPPPGPASRAFAERLAAVESRNVTFLAEDWPIFWSEAEGSNVRDVDGNVYIDVTSAFGVAFLGHRPHALVSALEHEALIHGMGDIHPPARKLELLERLASIAPFAGAKTVLANTGSEAVETALKTASVATGRPGLLAFEGGYHGLTMGSLSVTERAHFRAPFSPQSYEGVHFLPFPAFGREPSAAEVLHLAERAFETGGPNGDPIGALIIEPVQARGGARLAEPGFMAALSELAHRNGVLVIADEIFSGLGRCGAWFASERVGLVPDVVCVGKTLGAGLPISACIARPEVMDAWPASTGEAIHTSTFLGHPLACGAGLRALGAIDEDRLDERAETAGHHLMTALGEALGTHPFVREIRGLGLLLGIELRGGADGAGAGMGVAVARRLLQRGIIAQPAGDRGEVLELTPPVVITTEQCAYTVDAIREVLGELV
ncbi:MAG: aspartate aminotransferase family protein [Gemmatimonadota bacterium]